MGAISLGYGPDGKRIRRKVSGKTKQEVRDKLKALHQELTTAVKSSRTYTVRETVEDWLREGLDGTSERTRASTTQEDTVGSAKRFNLNPGTVHPYAPDHPQLAGAGHPAR